MPCQRREMLKLGSADMSRVSFGISIDTCGSWGVSPPFPKSDVCCPSVSQSVLEIWISDLLVLRESGNQGIRESQTISFN